MLLLLILGACFTSCLAQTGSVFTTSQTDGETTGPAFSTIQPTRVQPTDELNTLESTLATVGTSLPPTMDLRLLLMSVVLLGATLTLSVTDRPAQCKIKWTFGILCEEVYNRLVRQIKLWQISTRCLYIGEKCSYELVSTSPYLIKAAHTSHKTRTVNELQFLFEQSTLCKVTGDSMLDTPKDPEVNRTNFCSLQNLMDGSGLINAEGYTQFSNKWICPGFDITNCSLSIKSV